MCQFGNNLYFKKVRKNEFKKAKKQTTKKLTYNRYPNTL